MGFLRNLFANKRAVSKPVSAAKVSPELGFLKAKSEEKLALLRYLTTCGQMNATKLGDYLTMFEKFGNVLGPEKKAYILKSAPRW